MRKKQLMNSTPPPWCADVSVLWSNSCPCGDVGSEADHVWCSADAWRHSRSCRKIAARRLKTTKQTRRLSLLSQNDVTGTVCTVEVICAIADCASVYVAGSARCWCHARRTTPRNPASTAQRLKRKNKSVRWQVQTYFSAGSSGSNYATHLRHSDADDSWFV